MNISDKKILVTGGSGSLGRYLIKELLKRGARNIVSLSRDEGLIKEAKEFINSPLVAFMVGDTKDTQTVRDLFTNTDYVYHAAALKDVIFAEQYPREAVKNNIYGLLNLLDHSKGIKRFINVSSDKAIGVINCYGATKLLAEYLVRETNNLHEGEFLNVQFPNLLGSRGSVLDVWKKQAAETGTITVTNPEMTRFFITIPEAASFLAEIGFNQEVDVRKIHYPLESIKKFKLGDLAEAFIHLHSRPDFPVRVVTSGVRAGEKLYEEYVVETPLVSVEELKVLLARLLK